MPGILPVAVALRVMLVATGALDVKVATALPCPDAPAIARALQLHQVTTPGPGWQARIEPPGASPGTLPLRLRLVRPDGSTALERPLEGLLPAPDGDCDAAAGAIALILERRLRALTWASAPRSAAAPIAARTAIVATTRLSPAPPAPPSRRGPTLALLVGPAWTSGGPRRLAPAIEVRGRLRSPLHLGLTMLPPGTVADQALPGGGHARLQAWPLAFRALAEPTTGNWRPLAALDAGLRLERGESTAIAHPAVRWRPVLLAGGSLGLAWTPPGRWRIAAEAGLSHLVRGREFEVAGFGQVLPLARWQAQVGLRLGCVLWP